MTLALLYSLLFPCRYVRSHIDMQLAGQTGWESNVASDTQAQSCVPWINYPPSGVQINPCGLVAWSYFNDTYSVSVGAEWTPLRCVKVWDRAGGGQAGEKGWQAGDRC